jgi:hypothetical protein
VNKIILCHFLNQQCEFPTIIVAVVCFQFDAPSSGTTSSSSTPASASQAALGLTSTGQSNAASTKVTSSSAGVYPLKLSEMNIYFMMNISKLPYKLCRILLMISAFA